jgi:hypothetical protein
MVSAPILNLSGAQGLQRSGRGMSRAGLDLADWPMPHDAVSESWPHDDVAIAFDYAPEPQDAVSGPDPLGAVRGMLLAVAISVPMWAVIYWALTLVFR